MTVTTEELKNALHELHVARRVGTKIPTATISDLEKTLQDLPEGQVLTVELEAEAYGTKS